MREPPFAPATAARAEAGERRQLRGERPPQPPSEAEPCRAGLCRAEPCRALRQASLRLPVPIGRVPGEAAGVRRSGRRLALGSPALGSRAKRRRSPRRGVAGGWPPCGGPLSPRASSVGGGGAGASLLPHGRGGQRRGLPGTRRRALRGTRRGRGEGAAGLRLRGAGGLRGAPEGPRGDAADERCFKVRSPLGM